MKLLIDFINDSHICDPRMQFNSVVKYDYLSLKGAKVFGRNINWDFSYRIINSNTSKAL